MLVEVRVGGRSYEWRMHMACPFRYHLAWIRVNLKLFEDTNFLLYQCNTIERCFSPSLRLDLRAVTLPDHRHSLEVVTSGLATQVTFCSQVAFVPRCGNKSGVFVVNPRPVPAFIY